jgi:hypothetical protein
LSIARRFIRLYRKGEAESIDATFAPGKDISPVHNGDGAYNRQAQPMMGITPGPGGVNAIKTLEKSV